jgi:hypothetical protein
MLFRCASAFAQEIPTLDQIENLHDAMTAARTRTTTIETCYIALYCTVLCCNILSCIVLFINKATAHILGKT